MKTPLLLTEYVVWRQLKGRNFKPANFYRAESGFKLFKALTSNAFNLKALNFNAFDFKNSKSKFNVNALARFEVVEYINLIDSKRTSIAEMKLYFKCLFLVLACQSLPLNSSPDELAEKQTGVSDSSFYSSIAQTDDDKPLGSADKWDKVPVYIHLTADQVNDMQAEKNENLDFSQNVYVNLNSACNLESITQLVAFLILTLM